MADKILNSKLEFLSRWIKIQVEVVFNYKITKKQEKRKVLFCDVLRRVQDNSGLIKNCSLKFIKNK
jgi:hypothetical protein